METVNKDFKLGLGQALRAASAGGAYKQVGTLEEGKLADFIIVDFDWDAQHLLKARVDETWFAGKRVFKKA